MNTTGIFAEILIVGLGGATWILLTALSICGCTWFDAVVHYAKDWEALFTVIALGVVYTIGIFADRVADCLFVLVNPEKLLMKFKWVQEKALIAHADARMSVFARENRATDFLEHLRSRIRIARATALNTPLVTIALILFMATQTDYHSLSLLLSLLATGAVVTAIMVLLFGVLQITYSIRLNQVEEYSKAKDA